MEETERETEDSKLRMFARILPHLYMLCHIIIHAMSHHHTCYVTSSYVRADTPALIHARTSQHTHIYIHKHAHACARAHTHTHTPWGKHRPWDTPDSRTLSKSPDPLPPTLALRPLQEHLERGGRDRSMRGGKGVGEKGIRVWEWGGGYIHA